MFDKHTYTVEQKFISDFTSQLAKQYDFLYFLENMKKEKFPAGSWKVLAQEGYIGMLAPDKYGGTEYKVAELVTFLANMAQKGLASLLLMNQFICCDFLTKYGNDDQKEKYLKDIIGGSLCTYAFLEQGKGMSLFDIDMVAEKDGDAYKLNGRKCYVVGVCDSKYIVVAARTSSADKDDEKKGLGLFLLDIDTPDIEIRPREVSVRVNLENEMTMITGDKFYDLNFNNVMVPAKNLIGKDGLAGDYIYETSSLMMIMMAAIAIGWGENVLDIAVQYAKERVIFEEPIGSYQAIQHPMVRAKTELELAKLAVVRAANAYDNKEDKDEVAIYAGIAKCAATQAAFAACDIAIQTNGGYSFDRETGIITLWPLILLSRTIPLNNDVILEHFAEAALGLPA